MLEFLNINLLRKFFLKKMSLLLGAKIIIRSIVDREVAAGIALLVFVGGLVLIARWIIGL